jgi:hypothetical protein
MPTPKRFNPECRHALPSARPIVESLGCFLCAAAWPCISALSRGVLISQEAALQTGHRRLPAIGPLNEAPHSIPPHQNHTAGVNHIQRVFTQPGSFSTALGCSPDVRFPSDSDRIADIAPLRKGANSRHSNDSTARVPFNFEAPEPLVLRGGSPCHRGQQAIAPDRRSGRPSKTTACSGKSRTCLAPPVSRG